MKMILTGVDDVFSMPATGLDRGTLLDVLQRAFDRAGELAARHHLVGPLTLSLTDAAAHCLLTMTMSAGKSGWIGETEPGDVVAREGIPFPWFLVLEDSSWMSVKIRVELDCQLRLM